MHATTDHQARSRRGLALIELLVVLAVISILFAIMLPALERQRSMASLGESLSNLQQAGQLHATYRADSAGYFATFSWQKGNTSSTYADLKGAANDSQAAADQAIDIIRRRFDQTMPKQTNWFAYPLTSSLVLADHFGTTVPMRLFVSPADEQLLKWHKDPKGWQTTGAPSARHPYRSSYESMPTAFYDRSATSNRIKNGGSHSSFVIPGGFVAKPRVESDARFPSQKTMMWDQYQRHYGPRVGYYLFPESRVPHLFVDGSADVRVTKHADVGWDPWSPQSSQATYIGYSPAAWEPPQLPGVSNQFPGSFQWTRDMLDGRDFEVFVNNP
jgi:prepilin-type N-terminal cleavage/methylation domain-containing protein